MGYNRETFLKTARELKAKADAAYESIKEAERDANVSVGIAGYNRYGGGFQICDNDLFIEICEKEGKKPAEEVRDDDIYPFGYSIVIDGMEFHCINETRLRFEV